MDNNDRESIEDAGPGQDSPSPDSPSMDEIGSAPGPAREVHENADEIVADKELAGPDGTQDETHATAEQAAEVEPMSEVHDSQADGEPEAE